MLGAETKRMERPGPSLDPGALQRHRLGNLLQSLVLIAGMALLLAACGWIVAGWHGVAVAAGLGALSLAISGRLSSGLMLRMFRARPLARRDLPEVFDAVAILAQRAGLEPPPRLYYVASPTLNAFSVGQGRQAAVAVTSGLLQAMTLREVIAILAHEISHIRHSDIWVMGLADVMSRMTRSMSFLGIFFLIVNLPFALAGVAQIPWLLVLLLLFAPTLGSLLQLALSRTREFEADLGAVRLTGDPVGLARALERLERQQGRFWEDVFLGSRRIPDPSLLRSHPRTEERIRRLLDLRVEMPPIETRETAVWPRASLPPPPKRPRQRITGLWY